MYCRCGPLEDETLRPATVRRAKELMLTDRDSEALAPFSFMMARLAEVDPSAAGALLVDASRTVAGYPAAADSWKRRRAHRWRPALVTVIQRLSYEDWLKVMVQLASLDQSLLSQAIDVSIQHRSEEMPPALEPILTGVEIPPRVMAEYRASLRRRQRRVGSHATWLPLVELWWSTGTADRYR